MYTDKTIEKLRPIFKEMGRTKSDFDILKFTLDKEGPFLAHQYHFVIRQYQLTLGELKRFYLDKEETERTIKLFKKRIKNGKEFYIDHEGKHKFYEIEIERLLSNIDNTEYQIVDKKARCERYEFIRLEMEKLNGGPITDEQYQNEEPKYWKWNLTNQARQEIIARNTGISKGVVNALDMCSIENKILPNYKIEGILNNKGEIDIEEIVKGYTPKIKYDKQDNFNLLLK